MADIIPAILEPSLEAIAARLGEVRGAARSVQLDVADGVYVPNATWPFSGGAERSEFERIASEEEGLPLWEDFDFEADLMAERPLEHALKWMRAGASRIVIHIGSGGAKEALQALQEARGEGASLAVEVGVALRSGASERDLEPFRGLYDFIQVMGIEKVGFQGQRFDERAIILLERLRASYPESTLQVDGGITAERAPAIVRAGAERLVVGSAIFGSSDPKRALSELRRAAAL